MRRGARAKRFVSGLFGREAGAVAGKPLRPLRGQLPQALDLPDEIALPGGELVPSTLVGCARLLEAAADLVHVFEKLDEFVVDPSCAVGGLPSAVLMLLSTKSTMAVYSPGVV